ncbi:hypothetical protein [Pseudomonas aeruginosa]|uniref:hypothetical protein n=1 Tax=Pseudomonas aeruginosa TaxID=287 RepID=UPI0019697B02|nr:hypothetical protein [Pseudomonas aeruginosa]
MNHDKFNRNLLDAEGVRCIFNSNGVEHDGWIMIDGTGVDYADNAQRTFEPETVTTDNIDGLFLARSAVAERVFATNDFGFIYTKSIGWFMDGDDMIRVCDAKRSDTIIQVEEIVRFIKGTAKSFSSRLFNITDALDVSADWEPAYSKWRHGGWYVRNVQYPSGGCGCVSNNYEDGAWRIVCDDRRQAPGQAGDFTFKTRDEAARAERELVRQITLDRLAKRAGSQSAA